MLNEMKKTINLTIKMMSVEDFVIDETTSTIKAVKSADNEYIEAKKFIVTTGTFLRGIIHIGKKNYPAGRHRRDSSEV